MSGEQILKDFKVLVIGVSAGGFKALHTILPLFPKDFSLPILIVQHRQADSDTYLADSLNESSLIEVKEAEDKEPTSPGTAYIAPGGYHLLLEKDMSLSLSVDIPVAYSRPSIDVLFETASIAVKEKIIAVILTGANSDGSNGITNIKANNGVTIAQNPEQAANSIMPSSAITTDCVDFIKELEDIPQLIVTLVE